MSDEKQFIGGFDLTTPRVVDELDGVLIRLLKLRDFAADLHGIKTSSPVILAALAVPNTTAEPNASRASAIDNIDSLVQQYRGDPRSPYHQLRHKTRENYDNLIKRILKECGEAKLSELVKGDFERLYEIWKEGTKVAMAHSLMTMLRSMVTFGATVLEDGECTRLSVVLHRLKFEVAKPRSARQKERLTSAHVIAIRAQAHKDGYHLAALAQALQFEGRLTQTDVIGEWVPLDEPTKGVSGVLGANVKWVRGICWNQIDDDFVLRHVTSARQQQIEVDLKKCPMVMEELRRVAKCKPHETLTRDKLQRAARPVITSEDTRAPYQQHAWRRIWRKIADAAKVPKEIENRDSRMARRDLVNTAQDEKELG